MNINWKLYVKQFKSEEKDFGTEIALKNVLWNLAAEILKATGATRISTSYGKGCKAKLVKKI